MPSAHIISYTAHVGKLGQLGSDRLIVLKHRLINSSAMNDEASSEIYFADRFGRGRFGFSTLGTDRRVRAHLPSEDFLGWMDLLRHEDPVYLHWSVSEDPSTPDVDGIIHVATGPEPTGEGPIDLSP